MGKIDSNADFNIKEQEKLAFDRMPTGFMKDIPKTIVSRKKYKVSFLNKKYFCNAHMQCNVEPIYYIWELVLQDLWF